MGLRSIQKRPQNDVAKQSDKKCSQNRLPSALWPSGTGFGPKSEPNRMRKMFPFSVLFRPWAQVGAKVAPGPFQDDPGTPFSSIFQPILMFFSYNWCLFRVVGAPFFSTLFFKAGGVLAHLCIFSLFVSLFSPAPRTRPGGGWAEGKWIIISA